jgi:D-arabinose 1-dehydrogenase-like Zn-dependent alcohol dehydrogenase
MCRRPYLSPRNTVPESRSLSAKIIEACERMRKSDVKYRFVIDIASLA